MTKAKVSWYCKECGNETPRWMGKCPSCGAWNSLVEEVVKQGRKHKPVSAGLAKATPIAEVSGSAEERWTLTDTELNRVVGQGLVPGSVALLSGEPGIGKSTLLLQMALSFTPGAVLYVSGEESAEQIAQRAKRLAQDTRHCFLLATADTDHICSEAERIAAKVVVVDSIQTLECSWLDAPAGSISQIRESGAALVKLAKQRQVALFLVGHITKEGQIAGPKLLEHMVDTVLRFEGDQHHLFRILRCTKNRYGNTDELGIYKMHESGLTAVTNPSELLLSAQSAGMSGSVRAAILEGRRSLLMEVQALVSSAVYGTPQRSVTGYDLRRLHMLLAVLEKRCGFRLGSKDVFLNMAGGLKVHDPAVDLAVCMAVLSSSEDLNMEPTICFAAEVGLSGEIRPVNRVADRIQEAAKLGFERIVISNHQQDLKKQRWPIQVVQKPTLTQVLDELFG